jgi:ATP-binding cassette subfamily F protein 3
VLGNFLFSGEDVLKIVYDLSGGEKARLALAKLMMQKANLLILDEPTNHLDLDSKEVLENALIEYPGTLLFVSHDRYFVNRMATRVAELSQTGMTSYLGDYDYYATKKAEQAELQRLKESETPVNHLSSNASDKTAKADYAKSKEQQKLARQRQRRIEKIEQAIEEKELTISELEEALCDPAIFQDHEKVADLHQQLETGKRSLEELMEEWETLQLDEEEL